MGYDMFFMDGSEVIVVTFLILPEELLSSFNEVWVPREVITISSFEWKGEVVYTYPKLLLQNDSEWCRLCSTYFLGCLKFMNGVCFVFAKGLFKHLGVSVDSSRITERAKKGLPIGSIWYTVYLPTWMVDFKCRWIYQSHGCYGVYSC